jgi:hypothetical protein
VGASLSEKNKLAEVYDSPLIPALGLAKRDRHRGGLDPDRDSFILQTTRELIEELGERSTIYPPAPEVAVPSPGGRSVACLPAKDEADELIGLMLAQLLRKEDYHLIAMPIGVEGAQAGAPKECIEIIVVSALAPFAILHARTVCRRLRQECPNSKIVLGLWNSAIPGEMVKERLGSVHFDFIVTTLEQAHFQISRLATRAPISSN